jgi:hypothetical protein
VATDSTARKPSYVRDGVETDPPAGGCEGSVRWNTEAHYEDGFLADTKSIHLTELTCYPTEAGQMMAHISVQSEFLVDNEVRQRAGISECVNCNVVAPSTDIYYCAQLAAKCWGQHNSMGITTMLLPPGWYWARPPWDTCTLQGSSQQYPEEAFCIDYAQPDTIPFVWV